MFTILPWQAFLDNNESTRYNHISDENDGISLQIDYNGNGIAY